MFSGIIQKIAEVKNVERRGESLVLYVNTPKGWRVKPGDSISTDGACLTVEKASKGYYQCRLMPETVRKTTFGLAVPSRLNLEPAMRLGEKLDGHFVTGHIDAVGKITGVIAADDSKVYKIQFPREFNKLVAPKGSIAVDGISLTVVDAQKDSFTVSLVSYTLLHTTLGNKAVGDVVNLEFDILAKYVAASTKK